ncbi:MAG TPA: Sec-independent protein translocase protein TatB [Bradyrhizobium sp.]|nr:Sec-independent protein translocase protein TatB [Bradyrhizobium sp.]
MFDIGWSELVVIAVVALIAIGPKELPGVLRMVGQWMGKARKMAAEFQGQFQEAMREAEMADLKKSFDEVKEAATGFAGGNVMTSLQKDVGDALRIDDIDKPAVSASDAPAIEPPVATSAIDTPATDAPSVSDAPVTSVSDAPATPTTPEPPIPETFTEADAHAAAMEPLAITREAQPLPAPQDITPAAPEVLKDAKAS